MTIFSEELINQIPGFICAHDTQSKILFGNQSAAEAIGFRSTRELQGKSYFDMPCKASEDGEAFIAQDQLIFSGRKKVTFLSYHLYADGWKLILGEKTRLFDSDNNLVGLISHWSDITNYNLVDISRFLIGTVNKFVGKNKKNFTYLIEESISNKYALSNRQLECLFFLIRGKSDKEIAKILQLSPRTVESYISVIKSKLRCINRTQIIEKSLDEGMLNILPDSIIKNHFPASL